MPAALRRLLLLLIGLAMCPLGAIAQEKVGINTAVNPSADGTPPGGIVRKLVVGQLVLYNEHIVTGATGQTEILFLDQSALTVGPNAELTIDQFVYDPHSTMGKLVISIGHGIFRYVGGKLSKTPDGVIIRTPSTTIGVRGGEILLNVNSGGKVDAVLVYGKKLTLTGKSGCTQDLARVGYELTTNGPDGCAAAGHAVSSATVSQYLTQLDGIPGSNAGATTTPTDQTLIASDVASTISNNITANIQALNQIQSITPSAPQIDPSNLQSSFQENTTSGQTAISTSTTSRSSLNTTGGIVSSLLPNSGAFYGTISYPSSAFQNGALSVTVANVVDASNISVHGQPLSSTPNFSTFLAGFSGGVTISPLTAGVVNTPVTLTLAAAYNGPPLPISSTPVTTYSLNLGAIATGTATVTPDGQLVVANLAVNGPGIGQFESLTGINPTKVDNSGIPGSSLFLFSGVPTVTMPTVGIGSFSGTAMGSVANGGSQYTATGTFSESYNFSTLTGTLSIGNFDNASYTAPISGSGNTYSGTLSGPGRTGSVTGGFFGPIAADTGGTFSITGTSGPKYLAAGIFTGH